MSSETPNTINSKALKVFARSLIMIVFLFIGFSCGFAVIVLHSGISNLPASPVVSESTVKPKDSSEETTPTSNSPASTEMSDSISKSKDLSRETTPTSNSPASIKISDSTGKPTALPRVYCLICFLAFLPLIVFIMIFFRFSCLAKWYYSIKRCYLAKWCCSIKLCCKKKNESSVTKCEDNFIKIYKIDKMLELYNLTVRAMESKSGDMVAVGELTKISDKTLDVLSGIN